MMKISVITIILLSICVLIPIQAEANENFTLIESFGTQGQGNGEFRSISDMEFHDNGNIYVVDSLNHNIQIFDENFTLIESFGTKGDGNNQFNTPYDMEFHDNGNIYVVDSVNDRIQIFDENFTFIESIDVFGVGKENFNFPYDLEFFNNKIYVVDTLNDKIQIFDENFTFTESIGAEGLGNHVFNSIADIEFHNDKIYIVDSLKDSVQIFDKDFTFIEIFGSAGEGDYNFSFPHEIEFHNGNIYIVDSSNFRIQIYDKDFTFIESIEPEYDSVEIKIHDNKLFIMSAYQIDIFDIFIPLMDDTPIQENVTMDYMLSFEDITGITDVELREYGRFVATTNTIYIVDEVDNVTRSFDKDGGLNNIVDIEAYDDRVYVVDENGIHVFFDAKIVDENFIFIESHDLASMVDIELNNDYLYIAGSDSVAQVNSNIQMQNFASDFNTVSSVEIHDNKVYVVDSSDGTIYIFDMSLRPIESISGFNGIVDIEFTDDYVCVIFDNKIQIYDNNFTLIGSLGEFDGVMDVEFHLSGLYADLDDNVILLEIIYANKIDSFYVTVLVDNNPPNNNPPNNNPPNNNPPNNNPPKKKGGGGCSDCTPPTLGLNKDMKRIVDNGFIYNGNSIQVEKWHTPYPLINATVGELNKVEIIAYENQGINNMKWIQFGLGAEEISQSLNDVEILIEVHLETFGVIDDIGVEKIVILDKGNLIDNDSVTANSSVVKCQYASTSPNCVKVDLEYSYREETVNHIMLVNAMDKPRNAQSFYFNDGVNVLGESLNPPTTMMVHGSEKYEGLIQVTETARHSGIWIAEDGREFKTNSYGTVTFIHPPFERDIDSGDPKNRIHSEFYKLQEYQVKQAKLMLDDICPKCNDIPFDKIDNTFKYEFPLVFDKLDDPDVQAILLSEDLKARELLAQLFKDYYPSMVFD